MAMLARRTSIKWTHSLTRRSIRERCQRYVTISSHPNLSSVHNRFLQRRRQLKTEVLVSNRTHCKITSNFSLKSRVESNLSYLRLPSLVESKSKVKSSRTDSHRGNSRKSNYLTLASEAYKTCKRSHNEKCRSSRLKSSRRTQREGTGRKLIRARAH